MGAAAGLLLLGRKHLDQHPISQNDDLRNLPNKSTHSQNQSHPIFPQLQSLYKHKFRIKKIFIIRLLVQPFQLDASKASGFKEISPPKIGLWEFVAW